MKKDKGRPDSIQRGAAPLQGWALCLALIWGMTAGPSQLSGQAGAYAFQIRGGGTVSVGQFGNPEQGWEKEAGSGAAIGMGFTFPVYRFIGGFMGFSQYRFACDKVICPKNESWISTGFEMAARIEMGEGRARPWIQGGLHTHRIEVKVRSEGEARDITSQGGWGYEVGGGVLVALGEKTYLSPGARYVLGNVPFNRRPNLGLRFLVFDLGLVLGF